MSLEKVIWLAAAALVAFVLYCIWKAPVVPPDEDPFNDEKDL